MNLSREFDKPRIGKLDSVRGIAALMVLIGHCTLPVNLDTTGMFFWLPIFWDGSDAVIMFFLLSGYVLALQLDSPNRPTFRGFLVRRILRIWPAYAATILLAYLALRGLSLPSASYTAQRGASQVPGLLDLLQNLLMSGSPYAIDSPVWSLFVEMRLSIIFPLLFLLSVQASFFRAVLLSITLSIAGSRLVHWDMPQLLISLAEASRYLCLFVVGALLIRADNPVASLYRRLPLTARAAGLIVALLLVMSRFVPIGLPATNYLPWIGVTLLFIYCLYSRLADRLLNQGSMLFLGRISYGVYLVHFPIVQIANAYVPRPWSLLLVLSLSVLLGWAINVWIEQPMIWLGRKLSPPGRGPMVRPAFGSKGAQQGR
jgi:peptidoglycan/LPS O-acetylase OafA/YrhL